MFAKGDDHSKELFVENYFEIIYNRTVLSFESHRIAIIQYRDNIEILRVERNKVVIIQHFCLYILQSS